MKHKGISDAEELAAIAQKELDDLAMIDGGGDNCKVSLRRQLLPFFKKHIRRDENPKVNQSLESLEQQNIAFLMKR